MGRSVSHVLLRCSNQYAYCRDENRDLENFECLRRDMRGALSLTGCAGSLPTSPAAYRLYSSASFSVARPMSAVTASLSAAAQNCLNKTMSSSGQYRASVYGGHSFSVTSRFTASVTNSASGATLSVKAKTLHTSGFGTSFPQNPRTAISMLWRMSRRRPAEPTSRTTYRWPRASGPMPFAAGPQVRHPAQIWSR